MSREFCSLSNNLRMRSKCGWVVAKLLLHNLSESRERFLMPVDICLVGNKELISSKLFFSSSLVKNQYCSLAECSHLD